MEKRIIAIYAFFIAISTVLFVRIYSITGNIQLSQVAKQQSTYTLDVCKKRGTIYDCNLQPIVNENYQYIAAISPTTEAFTEISKKFSGEQRKIALENIHNGKPFLMAVDNGRLYAKGINVLKAPVRYGKTATACHIIGYCDGDGNGISGIELAYDELLKEKGEKISVSYATNMDKVPIPNFNPEVNNSGDSANGGVVLTIDKSFQKIAENAMKKIDSGACVIMDVKTGEIKSAVSMPTFSQTNVAKSLNDYLSPLMNRCFSEYSVGSTFKIVIAMAALEQGISEDFGWDCKGYTEVDGIRFGCHNSDGHRWCDMKRAIALSCNPYFINLGLAIDINGAISIASSIGFGKETELAPNIFSGKGNLPNPDEMKTRADIANLSFGQGKLLATPIQLAQMVCTVANGGKNVVPSLIEGITEDGKTISNVRTIYSGNRIVSEETAEKIRGFMVAVVEEGSGKNSKPEFLGAGGKTASAQTGQFVDGVEIVHAWFAGFYPAQSPKYAIVVLDEGGVLGGESAAPVFKEICDEIYDLKFR